MCTLVHVKEWLLQSDTSSSGDVLVMVPSLLYQESGSVSLLSVWEKKIIK